MTQCTLCFLVRRDTRGEIYEVCLGKKKVGFGQGLWAGIGGKVKEKEALEDAVIRETKEEVGVVVKDIRKVAEIDFRFSHKPDWRQYVYVYIADDWEGEIAESEEMEPAWFNLAEIPYDSMWEDAQYWLPMILKGEKIKGIFTYGFDKGRDIIIEKVVVCLNNNNLIHT
jgi:8-oxo-dGTP diphosphatase